MELPQLSFELKENYLLVIGYGKRNSLIEMSQAAALITEKAVETKSDCLLVDYRKLEIKVHLSEAFNIVKRYEVAQPELRNLKIAGVFSANGLNFANYWKEIGKQRGFTIAIFEDYQLAEEWLMKS
jgi:hypothetical protein